MYLVLLSLVFCFYSIALEKLPVDIQWNIISRLNLSEMKSSLTICKTINNNLKKTGQNNALMHGVITNNTDLVAFSLHNGANVNTKNNVGQTPFMIATENKNIPIMQLLTKYNADKTARNAYNHSALDHAMFLDR